MNDKGDKTLPARSGEQLQREAEHAILNAVREISFGSVEIVIHDPAVVKIECREKIRIAELQERRRV